MEMWKGECKIKPEKQTGNVTPVNCWSVSLSGMRETSSFILIQHSWAALEKNLQAVTQRVVDSASRGTYYLPCKLLSSFQSLLVWVRLLWTAALTCQLSHFTETKSPVKFYSKYLNTGNMVLSLKHDIEVISWFKPEIIMPIISLPEH